LELTLITPTIPLLLMKYPGKVSRTTGVPSKTPQIGPFYKGVNPVIGVPGAARNLPGAILPFQLKAKSVMNFRSLFKILKH
jgi:hypothetical protein